MFFYPTRHLDTTPDQIGLAYEDCRIPAAADESVHAWFFQGAGVDAPVVLFCHGNGGNISHRLETAELLVRLGAAMLLFDYRGYGLSDGSPSESNMYADAEACYDWLVATKKYRPDQIVLFGRSLGGAVAVELASRRTCRGMVVESSFTSAKDMGRRMFPYFPVGFLLRYKFDSLSRIGLVKCPVLITHSPDDEMIPYAMGRRLYDAAPRPKLFCDLVGRHNEREYERLPEYLAAINSLLSGNLKLP
jgi:pimeloyl-ACP methyl ester carboxylesterase